MILPMNNEPSAQTNALLSYLDESRRSIEHKMRQPQTPDEHKRAEKMLLAISSAITIVKNTQLTELTQQ